MLIGTLTADNAINGDQLCAEIQAALGIDVSQSYGFVGPNHVEIAGFDEHEAALLVLIAAHVPSPGAVSTFVSDFASISLVAEKADEQPAADARRQMVLEALAKAAGLDPSDLAEVLGIEPQPPTSQPESA